MVEGLHFDVPSEKVREILKKRIGQCEEKADLYEKQATAQKELAAKFAEAAGSDSPKFTGDQSANLGNRAKDYREKAKMYRFLEEHLIQDMYRLTNEDLRFLGIIDRSSY